MADITEQLRLWDPQSPFGMVAAPAAYEIDRLRDAIKSMVGWLDDPTGGTHVGDMRNARRIGLRALGLEQD